MLKLKELREETGLTQKQLAEAINNMQRNVSNWENGSSEPDLQTLIALADYFDVSLDELLGRDEHYNTLDNEIMGIIRTMPAERKKALLTLLAK